MAKSDTWDEEPNLANLPFRQSIVDGLRLSPKRIASKWLYDAEGSRLFNDIVASPNYYIADAELSILRNYSAEIAQTIGPDMSLVEFGSGASTKVRRLLDAMPSLRCYIPIEISEKELALAACAIRQDYPALCVIPLAADYTRPFELPPEARAGAILGFFPGSTLCNLLPQNSVGLLRQLGDILGPASWFLIGVDLKKKPETMLRAYNDPQGPIWHFNLNILRRLNRELGTGLDLAVFRHEATYNPEADRIEAAIYPIDDCKIVIGNHRVYLPAGERIMLEYSHKYTLAGFQDLASDAGWTPVKAWTDERELFSVHLLRRH